jgi:hypothetical protein
MGNPIYLDCQAPSVVKLQPLQSVSGQAEQNNEIQSIQNADNEHPIRRILLNERRVISIADDTEDLESMIIRQLRPRSFSLLFGNTVSDNWQEDSLQGSMETVMSRLRRQLRNSTARLAQDVSLIHRNREDTRSESRDRLEQIRRTRQDRRNDSMLFHSAFYRWNMTRGELNVSDEDANELQRQRLRHQEGEDRLRVNNLNRINRDRNR